MRVRMRKRNSWMIYLGVYGYEGARILSYDFYDLPAHDTQLKEAYSNTVVVGKHIRSLDDHFPSLNSNLIIVFVNHKQTVLF